MNSNELADGIPPALWANPKTEIHGIVDVRTYPLEGFIPLCVKQDADAMLRQQQAEIEALKKQNDDYWTIIEILRQRIKVNPLQDRLDEIAAGVVFGKAQDK